MVVQGAQQGRLADAPAAVALGVAQRHQLASPQHQTNQQGCWRPDRRRLLVLLAELGRVDGKAVASLAGVAPFARDSGLMAGPSGAAGNRFWPHSTW